MAVLYSATGVRVRSVRNLGWLLRNWASVRAFHIVPTPGQFSDCQLVATMDGAPGGVGEYRTDFACARLLWDWLHRPVFDGLPVYWGSDGPGGDDTGERRTISIGKPNHPGRTYPGTDGPKWANPKTRRARVLRKVPDREYSPIRGERHPSHYGDWGAYRDAVGATTEREESTARVRWDEWCKLCARARGD